MAKTCIKCGYTRGESETAPDYECPSCGVVYAKAEAAHARLALVKERAAAAAAAQAQRQPAITAPQAAAAAPAGDARVAALLQQVMLAQAGATRGPSPYRGVALVALVAFSVGFASAAGLYSGAERMSSKKAVAAAAACKR